MSRRGLLYIRGENMDCPPSLGLRPVADIYDEPWTEWTLRTAGYHLHPGREDATVDLARRAEQYGFPGGGRILEVASALGGPARYLARRFNATVVGIDMNPAMHRAARAAARTEGLALRCPLLLARTEGLPLRDGSMDAAWSQDAMCHMDKPAVVTEVARVLKPGALFAFSDWVAMRPLAAEDWATLAPVWGFPALLTIGGYVALLDAAGFEVLLAEDRTAAYTPRQWNPAPDGEEWLSQFIARRGEEEARRQRDPGVAWQALVSAGKTGYGAFVARRPAG